jgi:peptidoglycan hydrolase-like amidase
MSQYWALRLAELGYDEKQILGFYYPGAALEKRW